MKKLTSFLSLCTSLVFASYTANALDYYSVVGSGNWNNAATWSSTSGGSGGAGVPGSADNVFLETTVLTSGTQACNNLTIETSGGLVLNNPGSGYDVNIFGNFEYNGNSGFGLTIDNDVWLNFSGPGAQTIDVGTGLTIVGTNGTVAIENINGVSITGAGSLTLRGILAPVSGTLTTNGKLILGATSSTAFGRISFTSYNPAVLPNSGGGRTVYTGTISGLVTMEKVTEGTNDPNGFNAGWRQWSFPLDVDVVGGSVDGLDIQGLGQATLNQRNAFTFNSALNGTAALSPSGNTKPRNVAADAWAVGWQAVNESDLYPKGLTIWSTQNANTNSAYGYDIANKISVTGEVVTNEPIRGGYSAAGAVDATGVFLPFSQNPDLATGFDPVTGTEDIGWVQLDNPWPTMLDSWGMLSDYTFGGGFGNDVAADFNNNYGAVHVWNAKLQQYLGWGANSNIGLTSVLYNTTGGVTNPNTNQINFDILPFQSFWVRATNGLFATPRTLEFDIKYTKPTIDGVAYLKTSSLIDNNIIALAVIDEDSIRDAWVGYYDASFTQNFDLNGDIYKIKSASDVPTLFSLEGNTITQIANRPPVVHDTIQLFFASNKLNSTAHFHFNDAYGDNIDVVLHDKFTGTFHNLSNNPNYSFTHNTNNDPYRFELIMTNGTISIDENSLAANPVTVFMAGEELVIKSENFTGPAQIDCYDMAGRLLLQRRIDVIAGSEFRLTAPLAKNQINLITITANGQQYNEKLFR